MKKKIFIGILLILLLALILVFSLRSSQKVTVTTDKSEYDLGEVLRLTVRNNLTDSICFSPCSFGRFEIKKEEWQMYLYEECKKPDETERCIEPRQAKGFELIVSVAEPGLHRIVVPSCFNCQAGERFEEDERLYSNEFTIK